MDSRERFRQTMGYGRPDRVPYFHEGMEEDVIREWRKQGLSPKADLYEMFRFDPREEIEPDLEPHPGFRKRLGGGLFSPAEVIRSEVTLEKLKINEKKYPVEKAKGSAKKYTESRS